MVYELYEQYSEEEISRMVDAYVVATDGIYGDSEDSVRLYLEEILADQYSGMNRGGNEAARAREAVAGTAQRFAGDIENARQNRAGIERRNGPGQRFSFADAHIPTYEELIQKEPVEVVNLPPAEKGKRFSEQRNEFKTLAEESEFFKEPVLNRDTNQLCFVVPATLTHIYSNKGSAQLGVAKKIKELIASAVLTHAEPDKHEHKATSGVYTLFAAARDNGGPVRPVKIKVKEYNSNAEALPKSIKEYFDNNGKAEQYAKAYDGNFLVVEKIEKEEASSSAASTTEVAINDPSASPTINIADLLDLVKGDAVKYIPKPEGRPTDEIDWIGNRDEDMSGKDRVYLQAVKEGRKDEAKWMVDEAAKEAGYTHKGFHQTGADFTSFSTKNEVAGQFDDETPTGIFIKPTDEDIGLTSGKKQMPLYFKADNMLEFADRAAIRDYWKKNVPGYAELAAQLQEKDDELKRQYDELDAEWFKLYEETYDSDDQSALDALDKRQDEFLEEWNKALQPLRRQMKNLVTAYMKESKYDGIHLKYDGKVYGGPKVETYIVFDPEQVKSAEPVTYDEQGNVIPLSERFRADRVGSEEWKNRDIRFSPAEDDGEIDWIGKAQEDEKTDSSTSPRSAQNDSGEEFEAMAREKKLALAEKVGKYGLYSACSGLCSTLVLYAKPFFPVDSQYAEQRNQKIGLNLFQRQYKYEKACSVVLCPKFPVPGWAAADAGRAAALFPSGLRNKIPRFGKAIENQYGS